MGEWDTHGFRAHFNGQNEVDIGTCSKRFCFSLDECFLGGKSYHLSHWAWLAKLHGVQGLASRRTFEVIFEFDETDFMNSEAWHAAQFPSIWHCVLFIFHSNWTKIPLPHWWTSWMEIGWNFYGKWTPIQWSSIIKKDITTLAKRNMVWKINDKWTDGMETEWNIVLIRLPME